MTIAPSAQLPVRIAPITASAMRALILNLKWRNEMRPRRKVETPESATEITARHSPIRSGVLKLWPKSVRTEPPAGAKSGISSAAKASTSAVPSFFHGIEVLTGSDDFRRASCAEYPVPRMTSRISGARSRATGNVIVRRRVSKTPSGISG